MDNNQTVTPNEATISDTKMVLNNQHVTVTDIRMDFMSMVIFMVKIAFAAIPAAMIVGFVWMLIGGLLGGIFGM